MTHATNKHDYKNNYNHTRPIILLVNFNLNDLV